MSNGRKVELWQCRRLGVSVPQSSPRAIRARLPKFPHLSRRFCGAPRWCQWIRLSSRSFSASCSHTERRNVLPAEVVQLSQLPAYHTSKGEGKPHDWEKGRRSGKADGPQGSMHFLRRGLRSLRDIQWLQRTCCGVGGKDRGESRCCCEIL